MATIFPHRKGTNEDYVEDIRLAILEKKSVSLSALHTQYENSSRRLEEDIESCKRKILMCAGQEASFHLAKKKKNTECENPVSKENVIIAKSPYKSVKKLVDAAAVEFMVNAMKVVQLRKELRSRGLDTSGVKKDLRSRLVNAMLQEAENGVLQEASSMNHIPEVEEIQQPSPVKEIMQQKQQQRKEDARVETKEVEVLDMTTDVSSNAPHKAPAPEATGHTSTQTGSESVPEPLGLSTTSQESSKGSTTPGARNVSAETGAGQNAKSYWKNLVKASPANTDRKSKPAEEKTDEGAPMRSKSPLRALVKNAFKSHAASPAPTIPAKEGIDDFEADHVNGEYLEDDDVSPPGSEVSEGSKVSGSKVRDMVSKISGSSPYVPSTTPGVNATASALSKTVQAKKEARMAKLEENRKVRLEEMRNKSKNPGATMSKSITNPKDFMSCSLTSSLKASTLNLSAKKNIASQMREKAAAAYRKQDLSSSMAVVSEQYCHSRDDYDLMATTFDPLATTHDPMAATIKRAGFIRHDPMEVTLKPAGPVPVRLSIRSPMDTYEISEREDSDTDDDDDSDSSNDKQKKKQIPSWAQKSNLLPALEKQYAGIGQGKRCDPDEIFPEVQTCDLEAIFDKKKTRYTRRTSSGNWTKDRVTIEEKLVYKRTMGFTSQAPES